MTVLFDGGYLKDPETLDTEPVRLYETLALVLSKRVGEIVKRLNAQQEQIELLQLEVRSLQRKNNELETSFEWRQHLDELEVRGEL